MPIAANTSSPRSSSDGTLASRATRTSLAAGLVLAAAVIAVLPGCGGNTYNSTTVASTSATKTVTKTANSPSSTETTTSAKTSDALSSPWKSCLANAPTPDNIWDEVRGNITCGQAKQINIGSSGNIYGFTQLCKALSEGAWRLTATADGSNPSFSKGSGQLRATGYPDRDGICSNAAK